MKQEIYINEKIIRIYSIDIDIIPMVAFSKINLRIKPHTHIYIYMCVCVCVCVCL